MTINIHELNENQAIRAQVSPSAGEVALQAALSHAIAAQIANTGVVVAQTAVNNISSTEKIAILESASIAINHAEKTLAIGVKAVQNNPKNIANKENSYRMMQRSYLQTMMQELLAQLDELERTGYANWAIIGLIVAKLDAYSVQLNEGVIIPLEGLQGVDKAHSKLKAILEKMQAKASRGELPNEEDAKEFADAVKELKQAIKDLKDNLPLDDLGQPKYPSKEYKDLVDRLDQNLDKILKQRLDGHEERTIEDDLENPKNLLGSIRKWVDRMRRGNAGPFKEWEEGKAGFTTLRLELSSMTAQFSDKLSRDAELIRALNSTAQEKIKALAKEMETMTANQLSR